MRNILLYLWQFPQNIIGLFLYLVMKPEDVYDVEDVKVCYASRMRGGISLGRYIIIHENLKDLTIDSIRHEIGHTKQSRKLGWLYLFIIGIPSLIWAAWWHNGRRRSYYSFYTEHWADNLGGVKREE